MKSLSRLQCITSLNSGQGVGLDIYHLPLQIIGFLREMESADYRTQWSGIVSRAWETEPQKKRKKENKPFQPGRNWLYEDVLGLYDGSFLLPDRAKAFLRTYFLRRRSRYGRRQPRRSTRGLRINTRDEFGVMAHHRIFFKEDISHGKRTD